jgi:hypothetical protein
VRATVAPGGRAGQVHGIGHAPHPGPALGVTQLVRHRADAELLPAEAHHLGHERQFFQHSVGIERGEDLVLAAHLDQLARPGG